MLREFLQQPKKVFENYPELTRSCESMTLRVGMIGPTTVTIQA